MSTKVNTNTDIKQALKEITVELRNEQVELLKALFAQKGMIKTFLEEYPAYTRSEVTYPLRKGTTKYPLMEDIKTFYKKYAAAMAEYIPALKNNDGTCKEL